MAKAKKDSFKRVYLENGKHYYPQWEHNRLRTKGDMYFESLELTGSSKGSEDKPKISLLDLYKNEISKQCAKVLTSRCIYSTMKNQKCWCKRGESLLSHVDHHQHEKHSFLTENLSSSYSDLLLLSGSFAAADTKN